MSKKIIAIFDLSVTSDSPAGSCILQIIKNLLSDYQFIVFADKFENPDPEQVIWVRVPLPNRPVIFRYIAFKWLAPKYYHRFLKTQGFKPDLVIGTEGEFADCDICYAHFCHRAYLQQQPLRLSSPRAIIRFLNRYFNALTESEAITNADLIVVPSAGLANELSLTYGPTLKEKIIPISNPIDVHYFTKSASHDAKSLRNTLGFDTVDTVVMFAALGDFERKGLDLLLQALARLNVPQLRLLVVGGAPSEIQEYSQICTQLEIQNQVTFVGFQDDIRPYLWLSNLFALPSAYETFSLVTFQAAISGLPVMATQLYGVEEFLQPGVNGWLVNRNVSSIVEALKDVISDHENLKKMGTQAQATSSKYDIPTFIKGWQEVFDNLIQQKSKLNFGEDGGQGKF